MKKIIFSFIFVFSFLFISLSSFGFNNNLDISLSYNRADFDNSVTVFDNSISSKFYISGNINDLSVTGINIGAQPLLTDFENNDYYVIINGFNAQYPISTGYSKYVSIGGFVNPIPISTNYYFIPDFLSVSYTDVDLSLIGNSSFVVNPISVTGMVDYSIDYYSDINGTLLYGDRDFGSSTYRSYILNYVSNSSDYIFSDIDCNSLYFNSWSSSSDYLFVDFNGVSINSISSGVLDFNFNSDLSSYSLISFSDFSIINSYSYLDYITLFGFVSPPLVSIIFSALTDLSSSILSWFSSIFNSTSGLFYVDGSMTLLGTLILIGVAVSAFYFIFRFIVSFINFRR